MRVEVMSSEVVMDDNEDLCFSDSETAASIIEVLEGYIKGAPGDTDQYNNLTSIVVPSEKLNAEDEALLLTALKALAQAVHKIDPIFHKRLLNNIFCMSIWNYSPQTGSVLLELVASLAAVPDKFLDGSLDMLVSNFQPIQDYRRSNFQGAWALRKEEIHHQLHMVLHWIVDLVPLAPMKLKEIIDKRMPGHNASKEAIVLFVDCMLGLENDEIGEYLGSILFSKVVDLLTDLDVNISWENILQEDTNKDIFDMELEHAEEAADGFIDGKPAEEYRVLKRSAFADKLDGLMVVVCEHLKKWASDGRLEAVFEKLIEPFRKTMLNAYKSKFSQFIMFYACSLDPEICGRRFAFLLQDIFLSKSEDPISRMSAVAYLASYLSRAKFVSTSLVLDILKRLVDWCFGYCQTHNDALKINPKAHRIFYSGCQGIMYILCFRMRSIVDIPQLKLGLSEMPLQLVLGHVLNPLKVCLPSIVHEFLRQSKAASLYKKFVLSTENLLESNFSKDFGGVERLDMFFPFDPYLLKESDRFMRPNFEFWSMVKTTYSNCNSDDDEYEHPDEPDFAEAGSLGGDIAELDTDGDDEDKDELELSMNKMSITPKRPFDLHQILRPMPARMRASMSP